MSVANININDILLKRGNTAVTSLYVGPVGEVVLDTDLYTLRIQDGVTPGGRSLLVTNIAIDAANSAVINSNAAMTTYVDSLNSAMVANILAVNLEITGIANSISTLTTIDPALLANVSAILSETANINAAITTVDLNWQANAASQEGEIAAVSANVTQANLYLGNLIANVSGAWQSNAAWLYTLSQIQANNQSATNANVAAANAAIVAAATTASTYADYLNLQMVGNVAAANALIANNASSLGALSTAINAINSNVTVLQTKVYTNANASAYLAVTDVSLGNAIPASALSSLGNALNPWANLFVSGNAISVGGHILSIDNGYLLIDGNVIIGAGSGGILSNTDPIIQAIYSVIDANSANIAVNASNIVQLNYNLGTTSYALANAFVAIDQANSSIATQSLLLSNLGGNVTTSFATVNGLISNNISAISALNSNVAAANSAIANNTAAISNLSQQQLATANVVSTLQEGFYSNANVAEYLPTYSGNVAASNVNTGNLYVNGELFSRTLSIYTRTIPVRIPLDFGTTLTILSRAGNVAIALT